MGRTEGAYEVEARKKAKEINVWPTQEESCLYIKSLIFDLIYKRELLQSFQLWSIMVK